MIEALIKIGEVSKHGDIMVNGVVFAVLVILLVIAASK
jgi:hypothetical protein